ncbi:hypothetical protein JAK44_10035 [Stenotrophomonas maltophilia]|uniref:hypothetical protein n=1 Tax=Stenotrophomonas TaxID=40323 RepID=UPI0021C59292|nr:MULTISPECIES: hypothetical protein [Stenotrophomonas]MCU1001283.1 hypothetical protein [Stenotrophomonas maltophilia]
MAIPGRFTAFQAGLFEFAYQRVDACQLGSVGTESQVAHGAVALASLEARRRKLVADIGAGMTRSLGPYGAPTAMVFKGTRQGEKGTLYSYVAEFGPGAFIDYTVRLDEKGRVAGFAIE